MKLATGAGYWAAGPPSDAQETILEAEALGFTAFGPPAYGSDALTPLAWWGSRTESIQLAQALFKCQPGLLQQQLWQQSPWIT